MDIAKEIGVSHAALYAHFKDKSALLDAVSERWLTKIDQDLETVSKRADDPCEKIHAWMLALHQSKLEKVKHDPELFKAYNRSADPEKAFIIRHLENLRYQLIGLVQEAIAKRNLPTADPSLMASILFESMISFHHPRLVAQHLDENREALLLLVLESVLRGLKLKD